MIKLSSFPFFHLGNDDLIFLNFIEIFGVEKQPSLNYILIIRNGIYFTFHDPVDIFLQEHSKYTCYTITLVNF